MSFIIWFYLVIFDNIISFIKLAETNYCYNGESTIQTKS